MAEDFTKYIADFRHDRAEFSDSAKYPDEVLRRSLGMTRLHFGKRWGVYEEFSRFRQGWFFYVAHTIFMTEAAMKDVDIGVIPSSTRGIDSTSIDDEETTFGSQILLMLQPWEEELASSWYGLQYMKLKEPLKKIGFSV
jgi:hypothetical protein